MTRFHSILRAIADSLQGSQRTRFEPDDRAAEFEEVAPVMRVLRASGDHDVGALGGAFVFYSKSAARCWTFGRTRTRS